MCERCQRIATDAIPSCIRVTPAGGLYAHAMRVLWLTATIVGGLVFLLFATGTTYALLAPDYVFEDGELLAEVIILACSLALAAFGGHRLRRLGRRQVPAEFGAWLPPAEPAGGDLPELTELTARLRRTARRAAALTLVWVAVLAGGLTSLVLTASAAEDLLVTGARVPGVVVAAVRPVKGAPWIVVRYGTRTAEIVWHSDRGYHVGDEVTVVYDPADPDRVRTPTRRTKTGSGPGSATPRCWSRSAGCRSRPEWPSAGVAGSARWRRTGWRSAELAVVPESRHGAGLAKRQFLLHAGYRDGTGIALRRSASTHGVAAMSGREDRQAWIGGWGRAMVVVFPHGRRGPGPYAVPVYATATRRRVSRCRR